MIACRLNYSVLIPLVEKSRCEMICQMGREACPALLVIHFWALNLKRYLVYLVHKIFHNMYEIVFYLKYVANQACR